MKKKTLASISSLVCLSLTMLLISDVRASDVRVSATGPGVFDGEHKCLCGRTCRLADKILRPFCCISCGVQTYPTDPHDPIYSGSICPTCHFRLFT